jgi:hypothetical protein
MATAAPAFSAERGVQALGLWQDRIGEGVAYGEPAAAGVLQIVDPVAAVPVAAPAVSPRPAARAVAPATPAPRPTALKPVENQASREVLAPPPLTNLMAPRYDADVPMPHPDLEGYAAPAAQLNRAQPYFRGSDQGAVLGVRVPLAANRVPITSKPTRSSGGLNGLDGGFSR